MRIFLFCLVFRVAVGHADSFQLTNLTPGDFAKVTDDLSAVFTHTSVSGANPLGHVFGFEIGIIGSSTATPNLNRLVHEADTGASITHLPGGELFGALTVPFGLTVEVSGLPKVGSSDVHLRELSLGVKWTFTEMFPLPLPLDLAVKAQTTQAHLDAQQTVNDVATSYSYDGAIHALTLLAGADFLFVEPYIGFGLLTASGKMSADGAVVFAPQYSSNNQGSATRGSTELLVGAEFKLFVAKLGVEYARLFDTDRWAGKLAVFF